ncbi:pyruvate kinase [Microbacterium gilvum]|uniref:pyruvate kinase n=1 Tax=Microbacterium gilvum TaxID=1336204 RepID=A0ABP8ZQB1_9MICO
MPPLRDELLHIRDEVAALRSDALEAERRAATEIAAVHPSHRPGARNLVHYLALRAYDLRPLQARLSDVGLSSLGRMEADVLRNLDAVTALIDAALGDAGAGDAGAGDAADEEDDRGALRTHADDLLGRVTHARTTRIMVTLPSEAADDGDLVAEFAASGMDLARINCAHDDEPAWRRMADHVRAADDRIRIAMDLGGPKLRTGTLPEGPHVRKAKPVRDAAGRVEVPARIRFAPADVAADEPDAVTVPVRDAGWLGRRAVGDVIRFRDARGRARRVTVVETGRAGVVAEGDRTSYLEEGADLRCDDDATTVAALPPVPGALRVHVEDTIVLAADGAPARSADGVHRIACSLPEAVAAARVGDRVSFDDGRIDGVVRDARDGELEIEVTAAREGGAKLRAEKGVNLPDTAIPVGAVADDDLAALDVVVDIADIVQLSFARSADDVDLLLAALDARGAQDIGVVVKLETVDGFLALPEILLALMTRRRAGVMIARGDLAVEAGFERLAEVQEEMLWLCEAAHLPVVWATQVLEDLAKRGVPTRAEITDAASANRAECVMLNKGPRITDAIRTLDGILGRMAGHLDKKRPLLRRLRSWSAER